MKIVLSRWTQYFFNQDRRFHRVVSILKYTSGADPRFFLGGGALVSFSTSTPINHIVFFFFCRIPVVLENRGSSQEGGAHPLHPPPRSAPVPEKFSKLTRRLFLKIRGDPKDSKQKRFLLILLFFLLILKLASVTHTCSHIKFYH